MLFALPQNDLTLTYERSGFRETGRYAEAVAFCHALAKRSKFCRVIKYGVSPEGRPLLALIVSRAQNFSASTLGKGKRPFFFVQNGIHAGEIEGKDASLIFARRMLLEGKEAEQFNKADWMILPVYNVDGHERMSAFNRVNQNGPREMGWRSTAQNLNLNRDYVKADAPETRSWLKLVHRYKPDFFFDDHTTDGADYQYATMLGIPYGPILPPATAAFQRDLYETFTGIGGRPGPNWRFPVSPYFDLIDRTDPSKGIATEDFSARYSNGYLTALGRPSMLIETHVLKDYRTRVEATYEMLIQTSKYIIDRWQQLRSINRLADAPVREGTLMSLGTKLSERKLPFLFRGWNYAPQRFESAGADVAQWKHIPLNLQTTVRDEFVTSNSVAAPAAYVVPAGWIEAIDRLRVHDLSITRLARTATDTFASYRLEAVRFPAQPFEGRFMPSYLVRPVSELRTLPAGSAIVAADRLSIQLLEPEAPDSLAKWGFFNTIFERKEYFEDYAMAPIADRMLREDPAIKARFEAWLSENPNAKPNARLGWLFDHSPYGDVRLNAYPVVRLSGRQLKALTRG